MNTAHTAHTAYTSFTVRPIRTPRLQLGRHAISLSAALVQRAARARHVAAASTPEATVAAKRIPALTAAALVLACGSALAAEPAPVGWHPATSANAAAAPRMGIDPNTFLVGHPASPTTRGGHANSEHPAVLVARQAREPGHVDVDANTFIVQPPAVVTWRVEPEVDTGTRLAQARPVEQPVAR